MKISYNWLENYLNVNLPAEEVAALLTDIGLEKFLADYKKVNA